MLYDQNAVRLAVGCWCKNAQLLLNEKYPLSEKDFSNEWHKRLYQACKYIAKHGGKTISAFDIYNVAKNNASVTQMLDNNNTRDFIDTVMQLSDTANYALYYDGIRRSSIVNAYTEAGFDTEQFEHDPDKYTIPQIIQYFEGKQIEIRKNFYRDESIKEYKAGEGFEAIKEQFKAEPMYGASSFSEMLNTVIRGWIPGQLSVYSLPSGCGKSTIALSNLVTVCCPEIWSDEQNAFIENPCYQHHGGVYIQWEMDPKTEVTPKIVATISGVGTHNILNGKYEPGEEERVDKAIEILNRSNLYIVCMPNFTVGSIEEYIKSYVINHDCKYVCYDYITDGAAAFTDLAKKNGVSTRSDQALAAIAAKLKEIAVEYNVAVMSFTQTNAAVNNQDILDAGVIAGSRAIQNTCDVLGIMTPLRKKEQEVCEMMMEKFPKFTQKPNRVLSMAKVRFGSEEQGIKLWLHVNLNNGHVTDMWATNKFDAPVNLTKTKLVYRKTDG